MLKKKSQKKRELWESLESKIKFFAIKVLTQSMNGTLFKCEMGVMVTPLFPKL